VIRIRLFGLAGAILLLVLAGCALPQPRIPAHNPPSAGAAPSGVQAGPLSETAVPTSSSYPPRPAELRLDGVDPCKLLTPDQQNALGVYPVHRDQNVYGPGSFACGWTSGGYGPTNGWVADTGVNIPVNPPSSYPVPVQVLQIDGFTVIQGYSPDGNGTSDCTHIVDVAPGQSLLLGYDDNKRTPGMTHRLACQNVTKLTTYAIQNLRTLAGGN
jgi:hypothetical protein